MKRPRQRLPFILAMALLVGIAGAGPATTVALYQALILRPLPLPDPGRVVVVAGLAAPSPPADPVAFYKRAGIFDALFRYRPANAGLRIGGATAMIRVAQVSADFFALTRARPRIGSINGATVPRLFLSSTLYARLSLQPAVIGEAARVGGVTALIGGVMPQGYGFPESPGAWLVAPSMSGATMSGIGAPGLLGRAVWIGRLKSGVDAATARRALQRLAVAGASAGETRSRGEGGSRRAPRAAPKVILVPIRKIYGDHARAALRLALTISVLIALACLATAVALSVVDVEGRRTENAVRLLLGCGRSRILRGELARSAPPAAAGVLVAFALSRYLLRTASAELASRALPGGEFRTGEAWLVTAVAACLCFSFLAVTIATWRSLAGPPGAALKDHGTTGRGGRSALGRWLIAAHSCAAAAAIIAAAAAGLRLYAALGASPGFDPRGTSSANVEAAPFGGPSTTPAAIRAADQRAAALAASMTRLAASTRGVTAAAATTCMPYDCEEPTSVWIERPGWPGTFADLAFVTPGYFAAIQQPVLLGAWRGGRGVAVNRTLWAELQRAGRASLGTSLILQQHGDHTVEIDAVVSDVRFTDFDIGPTPQIYLPMSLPMPMVPMAGFTIIARGGAGALQAQRLRASLARVGHAVAIRPVRTVEARLAGSLRPARLEWRWFELAAAAGLLLGLLASFSLASAWAAGRRGEFAIRVACGAGPTDIALRLLTAPVLCAALGATAGVVLWVNLRAALDLSRLGQGWLAPVAAASVLALTVGTGAAALLPGWQAAVRDPLRQLRGD